MLEEVGAAAFGNPAAPVVPFFACLPVRQADNLLGMLQQGLIC